MLRGLLKKTLRKTDKPTLWLFTTVYSFIIGLIVSSASRPMWYDEVWRAYMVANNMRIPIQDNQGLAPISVGFYAFTKFATLVFDNNFTQRTLTYLCLLALPIAIYWFCKLYIDKRTAQFMVVIGLISGFILEFSTQNKPYIMDTVCLLSIGIAFHYFARHKLNKWAFTALCAVWLLFSFAAYFVIGAVFLVLLARSIKKRNFKFIESLLPNGLILGCIALMHGLLFIKPQVTSELHRFFTELYPHGSLWQIAVSTIKNLLTVFDLVRLLHTNGTISSFSVFWTYPQFEIANKAPMLQLDTSLKVMYLGLFLWGLRKLWQKHQEFVCIFLGILSLQWVASLLRLWPFGNSRTNTYSLLLFVIITCYGALDTITTSLKKHRLITTGVLVAYMISVFPYRNAYNALVNGVSFTSYQNNSDYGIVSGGQEAALLIAREAKYSDKVYVDANAYQYPIRYYYEYSDYIKPYKHSKTSNIYYGNSRDHAIEQKYIDLLRSTDTAWYITSMLADDDTLVEFKRKGFEQEVKKLEAGGLRVWILKYNK